MTFTNVTTKHTTTSSLYTAYAYVNSLYIQKNDKEIHTQKQNVNIKTITEHILN